MYKTRKYSKNFKELVMNPNNEVVYDLKLYEKLLNISCPSTCEGDMIKFIIKYLSSRQSVKIKQDDKGNLYVTKGILSKGEYFPCLVAHLDEVHSFNPNREIVKIGDFYMGWDSNEGEQIGIGADDKNGIFIALTLLDQFDKIKLFFPVEEEVGLIGTNCADMKWFTDIGYIMQCDRRGYTNLITYTNGLDVTSQGFLDTVDEILITYGYEEEMGTCTDIGGLVSRGIGVSACNISCGYWDEHMNDEITHIPSMINCMNLVYHMITWCGMTKYPHVPNKKAYSSHGKYGGYHKYGYSGYGRYDKDDLGVYGDWYDDDFLSGTTLATEAAVQTKNVQIDEDDYHCAYCRDQDCMNCKHYT